MKWVWSYAVWAAWLLLFVALELCGVFRAGPWVTLSETAQHAENTYPLLVKLLFGFLLGLALHITTRIAPGHGYIHFWRAVAFGMIVAFAASVLNDPAIP